MRVLLIVSICLMLTACSHSNPRVALGCTAWEPIRIERSDIKNTSLSTKRQILAHNTMGRAICGW